MPRVSVILTTCGRWELLARAIRSVLDQEYQDFELLVVVDQQNIPSKSVVRRVIPQMPGNERVVWLFNDRPGTKRVAASCNVGLDNAQGEFAAYLCDDDHWMPGHLSKLMTCIREGARWAVDKCQWVTPDGLLLEQETIGQYRYAEPFEVGHELLAQKLVDDLGCNFIVHDCTLHEITADRWPVDAEHQTPVDWRFWCSLWRRGLMLTCVPSVGAVAFVPGAWRAGLSLEKANDAMKIAEFNTGGVVMHGKEDRLLGLARNMSGKVRNVVKEGRKVRVMNGCTVAIRKIAKVDADGNVRLPPGFVPEYDDLIVPALEDAPDGVVQDNGPSNMEELINLKEDEIDLATVSEDQADEVVLEDTPTSMDELINLKEDKVPLVPTAEQVAGMSYNDVRGLAKALGVGGLNRSKLDIVKDIDAVRVVGVEHVGGCFDGSTITSADIARPPSE